MDGNRNLIEDRESKNCHCHVKPAYKVQTPKLLSHGLFIHYRPRRAKPTIMVCMIVFKSCKEISRSQTFKYIILLQILLKTGLHTTQIGHNFFYRAWLICKHWEFQSKETVSSVLGFVLSFLAQSFTKINSSTEAMHIYSLRVSILYVRVYVGVNLIAILIDWFPIFSDRKLFRWLCIKWNKK